MFESTICSWTRDVISGGARVAEAPPNNFDDTEIFLCKLYCV